MSHPRVFGGGSCHFRGILIFSGNLKAHILDRFSRRQVERLIKRLDAQFGKGQRSSVNVFIFGDQGVTLILIYGIERKLIEIKIVVLQVYQSSRLKDLPVFFEKIS